MLFSSLTLFHFIIVYLFIFGMERGGPKISSHYWAINYINELHKLKCSTLGVHTNLLRATRPRAKIEICVYGQSFICFMFMVTRVDLCILGNMFSGLWPALLCKIPDQYSLIAFKKLVVGSSIILTNFFPIFLLYRSCHPRENQQIQWLSYNNLSNKLFPNFSSL